MLGVALKPDCLLIHTVLLHCYSAVAYCIQWSVIVQLIVVLLFHHSLFTCSVPLTWLENSFWHALILLTKVTLALLQQSHNKQ